MNQFMKTIKISSITKNAFLAGAGAGREMFRELFGARHRDYAATLQMVGLVYQQQNQPERVAPYFQEAAEIFARCSPSTVLMPPAL